MIPSLLQGWITWIKTEVMKLLVDWLNMYVWSYINHLNHLLGNKTKTFQPSQIIIINWIIWSCGLVVATNLHFEDLTLGLTTCKGHFFYLLYFDILPMKQLINKNIHTCLVDNWRPQKEFLKLHFTTWHHHTWTSMAVNN